MPLSINSNISAGNAARYLEGNNQVLMGAANSPCERIEVSLPDMQTGADLLNPGSASLARLATARAALSAVAVASTH